MSDVSLPSSSPSSGADAFWTPAQRFPQLWRSLLGLFLIHVTFFAATFGIILAGGALLGFNPQSVLDADTPAKTMVFFATFIGYHIGLWLVVRFLHKRPYRSLFGPTWKIRWRHFAYGMIAALAVAVTTAIIETGGHLPGTGITPPDIFQHMGFARWITLLPFALGLIFLQIMAEELVFRGYLLQQLRARFQRFWIWGLLPSLIFGVLHFDPTTYGINAYFYVLHTTVVGVILSLITLRTGNIGAAAGLHMANNSTLLVLGNEGSLDGLSLFLSAPDLTSPYVGASILMQTTASALAFAIWWRLAPRTPKNPQAIANAVGED
ncbi:hypothetical protein XMM379_002294 [Aliiroseovarius sp. xm-m-379]|uniref:CPBP family intramembrane glutamic endopeptidase n=1 Tax=unclassified Aliiroseovarius TaxID=2623558 RepID=UPI001569BABE|nr:MULTISPECIES: CPBP family intramembrane glutamic endopeptidase [unclassified Aliiroseovarius]NRP13760.1 hypothetical protein [Aliiroseovarius sp. xm-d-517]NRP25596.1 hypothetical protein [Aliiroseovarius sp. xm-m-379]NRP29589.1 hypothetical protein [Aliiroseovarius sp. xm-m-314]NRP34395.1 hypothetical protein [Aliiroseovarius sp. xm-a-104]NRP41647.1 hypothetical protein [Aliiroseovarius sp. xm-m-339-2]